MTDQTKKRMRRIVEILIPMLVGFLVYFVVTNASLFVQPYVEVEGERLTPSEWMESVRNDPAAAEGYIGKEITVVGKKLVIETNGKRTPFISYRTGSEEIAKDLIVNAYLILDGDVVVEVSNDDARTLRFKQADLVRATGVIAGYQVFEDVDLDRAVVLDDVKDGDDVLHTHIEPITNLDALKYLLPF